MCYKNASLLFLNGCLVELLSALQNATVQIYIKKKNKLLHFSWNIIELIRSCIRVFCLSKYIDIHKHLYEHLHMGACGALLSVSVDVCFPDRKWVAYSKLYQSLEVDSSVLFQQLTSIEYHWHQQALPYQQVEVLTNNYIHLLNCDTWVTFEAL